jgi:hypothetical protein
MPRRCSGKCRRGADWHQRLFPDQPQQDARSMLTPEWTPLLTVIQMISAVATWHPEAAGVDRHDALCLARNIYFEARGEGSRGQYAVAAVTMNRVRDKRWSDGICGVVYQKKQFSWTISRPASRPTVIGDRAAWQRAAEVAVLSLVGLAPDYSQGATHYVAPERLRRMPVWTSAMTVSHRIDGHVFFADQGRSGKASRPRGPNRNTPKTTAVTVELRTAPSTVDPALVKEARVRVEERSVRQGVRPSGGSNYLLPIVNVDATALPARRSKRKAPSDPWNDPMGTAMERRIRAGARRLAVAW